MDRIGSCFDNAAVESFFSPPEHEILSRRHFATKAETRAVTLVQLGGIEVTRRMGEDHC